MTFAARAGSILGYRVVPTSVLALATYLVILALLIVTDTLPAVPKPEEQGGLSLKEALTDLQHITAYPHPYNSHANDKVHDYILSRLETLAQKYPHVHVVNDIISNRTWFSRVLGEAQGEYVEGTNILVKVDGTSGSTTGGVLFSAHYDSVPTARGATDDGVGVATLMQLVKCFATDRQPRTAVFNINNGEEDGLHGSNVFLEHPWSKLTDTFLNLEGAAAGGRPILFRATSEMPVRASGNRALVPHPHANVLSSDAFSRGFIKSGTDFTVYAGLGKMKGLDLAFYKGRSKYHTKFDGMQHTVGGEKSLWSMMEVARGLGIGLLSAPASRNEGNNDAVYFDVFKSAMVILRLKNLWTFNVVLLIMGPLFLMMLVFCETIVLQSKKYLYRESYVARSPGVRSSSHSRAHSPNSEAEAELDEDDDRRPAPAETYSRPYYSIKLDLSQVSAIWRHAKFWVALVLVIALQIFLVRGYVKWNPFAIHSSPYLVMFSFTSLAYLTLVHVLTFPSSLPFFRPTTHTSHLALQPPAQQDKQTLFFYLYAFTWLFLVLATIGITHVHPGIGGGYLMAVWNTCVAFACVLVGVEGILAGKGTGSSDRSANREERLSPYDELSGDDEGEATENDIPNRSFRHVEDTRETTPFLYHDHRDHDDDNGSRGRSPSPQGGRPRATEDTQSGDKDDLSTWWWIVQFLVSVPVPVALFSQVAILLLDSMPQTLSDGGAPWRVYAMTSIPAVLLVIPLAPFAAKLQPCHRLTQFILGLFIVTTLYAWLTFPFSIQAPLKIFFRQSVSYPGNFTTTGGSPTFNHGEPKIITELTGAKPYLPFLLIPSLPSAQGAKVECRDERTRPELVTCAWESKLLPSPGLHSTVSSGAGGWDAGQFFKARVQSTGTNSGRVHVKGRNTRACRLYFDSVPADKYHVRRAEKPGTGRSMIPRTASLSGGMGAATVQQTAFTMPLVSTKELRFWTRTWEQELAIDFSWSSPTNATSSNDGRTPMQGRIGCEWAEYESGMVDNGVSLLSDAPSFQTRLDAVNGAKIPAFEEALAYLPDWAVLTKFTDGLVEVWAPFVI